MNTTRRNFIKHSSSQAVGLLGAAGLLNSATRAVAEGEPPRLPTNGVIADKAKNAPLSMLFHGKTANECSGV